MKIGQFIGLLRTKSGISKKTLSESIHIPEQDIILIEKGEIVPTQSMLEDLAHVLNVSPTLLFLKKFKPERDLKPEQLALFNELFPTWESSIDKVLNAYLQYQ